MSFYVHGDFKAYPAVDNIIGQKCLYKGSNVPAITRKAFGDVFKTKKGLMLK